MCYVPHAVRIVGLLWAVLPLTVMAQGATMRVRITGPTDAGVPAVLVTLRDESGRQIIAEGVTTSQGEVRFDGLPASAVRLSVRGTTGSGQPISLGEVSSIEDESLLVRTDVGGPDVLLVMDKDGSIYVDPQQISPGQAERAPASAAISAAAAASQAATPGVVAPAPAPSQPAGAPPWLLVAIGGLLTVAVLILSVERRAS